MDINKEKAIEIAHKLKKIRLEKNKKQQDVADYLGMTKQSYFKYEKGIASVNMKLLIKLSKYYGLPEYYFLLDKSENSNENFMLMQWIYLYESIYKWISKQLIVGNNSISIVLNNNVLVDELLVIQEKIINYFHNKSSDLGIIVRSQFSDKLRDRSIIEKKK